MKPRPTIEAFDAWLSARALRLDAVLVGGSALALLGITDRQTRDVDVLHPKLSVEVLHAAAEFAKHLRNDGVDLEDGWLNNGPMQLADVLPDGWRDRVQDAYGGVALTLTALGRADLLKSKLFALCDRGTDLADCIAIAPSAEELSDAEPWLAYQDANPMWPEHVRATLHDLNIRLGHAV